MITQQEYLCLVKAEIHGIETRISSLDFQDYPN